MRGWPCGLVVKVLCALLWRPRFGSILSTRRPQPFHSLCHLLQEALSDDITHTASILQVDHALGTYYVPEAERAPSSQPFLCTIVT